MRNAQKSVRVAGIGMASILLATLGAGVGTVQAGAAGLPKKATVHITKANVFSKTSVNVVHTSATVCTTTAYTVKFVNSSKSNQEIDEVGGGVIVSSLSPKGVTYLCVGIGTITLSLASNPTATLSITVS